MLLCNSRSTLMQLKGKDILKFRLRRRRISSQTSSVLSIEKHMKQTVPARPHGAGIRGLDLSRNSPLFEGPFGRIFRTLPPADFGDDDQQSQAALAVLADKMIAAPDPPKDGPDDE